MKKILTAAIAFIAIATYSQTGNVGINTSTPSAALDIVSKDSTSATKALEINNSSNTEMVTVLNNGNVGVGTSSPTNSLHVNGSFRLNDGTEQNARVLTSDSNGVGTWQALSAGNKTAVITGSGTQNFSTSSGSTFSGTYTISSNQIGATVNATNIFLSAGKYLITISEDIADGEYGIFTIRKGSNNAVLYTSYYGEWFNGSFLLDISGGNDSIYYQFQGLTNNPSAGYYRNNYNNAGWNITTSILKLN